MPRLLLLTAAELTRDPRARRQATVAGSLGWEVVGVCVAAGGPPVPLEDVDVTRVAGARLDVALRGAGLGGGRRDRWPLRELRGVYRLARLARTTAALYRAGRSVGPIDVVHANDFDTLPAGRLLARKFGARLVYDAHELYTLQEVDPPRAYTLIARALERLGARAADAVVTVSEPIARELTAMLKLSQTPLVVLNCPARTEHASADAVGSPLRAIYQGAVGLGRSVDDLLDAAAVADGVELTLRVVGVEPRRLREEVSRRGLDHRVSVRDAVDPGALVDALTEFDVGIVATRPLTRNDELAAPNKLFEYLMAGLAVAVPDVPGVGAIVEAQEVGVTFAAGSPTALGEALSRLAAAPDDVRTAKAHARAAALRTFNAEAQAPALVKAWTG